MTHFFKTARISATPAQLELGSLVKLGLVKIIKYSDETK